MFEEVDRPAAPQDRPLARPAAARTLAQKPLPIGGSAKSKAPARGTPPATITMDVREGYAFYLDGPDREDLRQRWRATQAVHLPGANESPLAVGRDTRSSSGSGTACPTTTAVLRAYLIRSGPTVSKLSRRPLGNHGTDLGTGTPVDCSFSMAMNSTRSLSGGPVIAPKTWNHVRLGRRGEQVARPLERRRPAVFSGKVSVTRPADSQDVFVGGRSDNFANSKADWPKSRSWPVSVENIRAQRTICEMEGKHLRGSHHKPEPHGRAGQCGELAAAVPGHDLLQGVATDDIACFDREAWNDSTRSVQQTYLTRASADVSRFSTKRFRKTSGA